jgi:hypothetical protein
VLLAAAQLQCNEACRRRSYRARPKPNEPNAQNKTRTNIRSTEYDKILNSAEQMILSRFVGKLPSGDRPQPVVHIVKVRGAGGGAGQFGGGSFAVKERSQLVSACAEEHL